MKLISFLSLFREFMPLLSESSKYESLLKLGSQVTENMLLDKNRIVKIADFGVSRLEASNLSEMTGYTGSPGYMAPEVLDSKPYDKKCDIYSFGICLWEIYCCKKTYSNYSSSNISQLITDVVYKNVRPEIPKSCPQFLGECYEKMLGCRTKKKTRDGGSCYHARGN